MRSVSLVLAFGFVVILGLLVVLVLSGAADKQAVACFSLAFLGIGAASSRGWHNRRGAPNRPSAPIDRRTIVAVTAPLASDAASVRPRARGAA